MATLKPSAFERRWRAATPTTRSDLLRARFRYDAGAFARWCWPDRFRRPFNRFQKSMLRGIAEDVNYRERTEPTREALAAPRGYAKSTIGSFVEVVHDIVYGLEAFEVILSNGTQLAFDLVADIKAACEDEDSELAKLYGPLVVTGTKTDFTVSVRGAPSVRVLAKSYGQQIRGVKHRGIRPTKIIGDDCEHSKRVQSPEQRKDLWRYTTDDVLKAGDDYTTYRFRGTVLHPDAMLANLLKRPGWKRAKWKAIIAWPKRMDLWSECQRIWAEGAVEAFADIGADSSDEAKDAAREAARPKALAFYEAHRAEMDEGAEVLDANHEPLFACFELIWSDGLASFLREKQNEPVDPSSRLFDPSRVTRCRVVGDVIHALDKDGKTVRKVPFAECRFFAHLDPALGDEAGLPGDTGSGAGDYASIAVIARDRHGYGYLLHVWMRRATPSQQLLALWEMHERYGFHRISIESNGFQSLVASRDFEALRAERKKAGKSWQLACDADPSTENKKVRIATLEVPLSNGWLLVDVSIDPEALGQVWEFPTGAHDDGPDSIEACWRNSRAPVSGGVPFQPGGPPASSRPGARR